MWQSWVEIEHYFVAQFDHVTVFKAPWRKTSVKGGAHVCSEDAYKYLISLRSHMSPALNGSSALQCFEHGNVVEICNGTMFDFYPRLPHIYHVLYTKPIEGTKMYICERLYKTV